MRAGTLTLPPRWARLLDGHASKEEADHCLACGAHYGPSCRPAPGYALRLCAACVELIRAEQEPTARVHKLAVLERFRRLRAKRPEFRHLLNLARARIMG